MKIFSNVLLRIFATFVASSLAVIGAGSMVGVNIWISASMGGILAVFEVIKLLAIAFLEDGKLTEDEINAAFRQTLSIKGIDEKGNKIEGA
jgi:hypothetical protein